MIPQLILDHFEPMHINLVFDELQQRFGFPKKIWKKQFDKFLGTQSRNTSELDAFIKFGNMDINPILNLILVRYGAQPTFNKLLLYIIEKHSVPRYRPPRNRYNSPSPHKPQTQPPNVLP